MTDKIFLNIGQAYSMNEIVSANEKGGGYFFSENTMRNFQTRLSDKVYVLPDSWLFVTSDIDFDGVRMYKVRAAYPCGQIDSMLGGDGTSLRFDSLRKAHAAAKYLAETVWHQFNGRSCENAVRSDDSRE